MDKSVKVFDPRTNKDLVINDAIERGLIDKTSGMIIDPKSGALLSIKEAVKRGVVSVTGAPLVTGKHECDAGGVESSEITSRKVRHTHTHGHFDNVSGRRDHHLHHHHHHNKNNHRSHSDTKRYSKKKTPIEHDLEFLNSDFVMANLGLGDGGSVITNIKLKNEEGVKRTNLKSGDVTMHKVKGDYKETVLQPGHSPKVTSKGSYENEIKQKITK